jgi:hypothetical protein
MTRFAVSTRLNGHPPLAWRCKETHYKLGFVRARKDKLGRYYLVEVTAFTGADAKKSGMALIENYVRCLM